MENYQEDKNCFCNLQNTVIKKSPADADFLSLKKNMSAWFTYFASSIPI